MARYPSASEIYKIADAYRERCLLQNASLIWPDEPGVWTSNNLSEVWDALSVEPIAGGTFMERLEVQLASKSEAMHRLAADCLALYYLFPTNVGGDRKIEQVSEVISWKIGGELPNPDLWRAAFSLGIGSAGTFFVNRPWEQYRFLLAFSREAVSGKFDPTDAAAAKLAADNLASELSGTRPARNVLLHLLFPDEFERIASETDREEIISALSSLVDSPSADPDEVLMQIREALREELGREIDFYDDEEIVARWKRQSPSPTPDSSQPTGGSTHKEITTMAGYQPTMKILQGPPGTGKTYHAARAAVEIIDGSVSSDIDEFRKRHAALVETGRIVWVTFHPSFSYEDFVEGFRPVLTDSGQVAYKVTSGPFLEACNRARQLSPLSTIRVGDHLGGGHYEVIHVDSGGVALKSLVTRRDAVIPEIVQYADLWTIDQLRQRGVSPEQLSIAGSDNEKKAELTQLTGFPTTLWANSSHYRAVYERLYAGGDNPAPQPVVLVIDEINRADLSRVFGELITLLEPDKREGAPEERSIVLAYSKARLTVPAQLSVIGTMNTADRSLAVVDVALRRRFEFEDVEPDPGLCPDDYGGINVSALLSALNERMTVLLSRDSRFGHSDLMQSRLEAVRESAGWPDDTDGRRRTIAATVRHKMLPLLLEYFYEDWQRADVVLGRCGLLTQFEPENIEDLAEGVLDLADLTAFRVENWWDPGSTAWNGDLFAKAIGQAISGQSTV